MRGVKITKYRSLQSSSISYSGYKANSSSLPLWASWDTAPSCPGSPRFGINFLSACSGLAELAIGYCHSWFACLLRASSAHAVFGNTADHLEILYRLQALQSRCKERSKYSVLQKSCQLQPAMRPRSEALLCSGVLSTAVYQRATNILGICLRRTRP